MQHIRQEVRQFLAERGMAPELSDQDDLFAVGGLSSLVAMQIVTWVERRFGVAVRADDLRLANFRSVDSICAFVEGRTPSLSGTGTESK